MFAGEEVRRVLNGNAAAEPAVLFGAGVLVAGLLMVLVYVLATTRARARRQVERATAELRAAEAASRRHAELLDAVMDSICDGVTVADENGEFLVHNPSAKRILGIGEAHGGPDSWQGHYGVFLPDGSTPFPTERLPLVRALAGESTDEVQMVIRNPGRPDGVHIAVSTRPLANSADRPGAVAVFRDITAQRAREAELKAFAGVVAHDLKSPLTAIIGYAEVLQDELTNRLNTQEGSNAQWVLDHLSTTSVRMRQLIHDLLNDATAQSRPLHFTDLDLTALVKATATARTEQHRASTDGPTPCITVDTLPAVHADPALVHQLVDNLIGNAVKYTHPGVAARIDISGETVDSGQARIEIADQGIGIPAGQREEIFTSFHRAHTGDGYAGPGLGLSICRHIIERHGGIIAATDNPGGGARFSFTLPLAPQPSGRTNE
ncbi:sensor histidine kinase [Streptomyces sp. CA-135486]|uniref:sensor histidine kinase n=1 Tax=Streptomyces sp. CA-135486 TaxID=3240049 RepID=UPI003D92CD2C